MLIAMFWFAPVVRAHQCRHATHTRSDSQSIWNSSKPTCAVYMNSLIAVVTERRQSNRLLPVFVRLKLPLKRSMRAREYSKNRKMNSVLDTLLKMHVGLKIMVRPMPLEFADWLDGSLTHVFLNWAEFYSIKCSLFTFVPTLSASATASTWVCIENCRKIFLFFWRKAIHVRCDKYELWMFSCAHSHSRDV